MKLYKPIFILAILLVSLQVFSTPVSGASGELLISEVLYDTPGTDSIEEWIEIYNPGSTTIDLSSYTVSDNVATNSLSGSIAPGGTFIIASNAAGFNALYGFNPDLDGMSLALGNSGDFVLLENGATLVDQVGWEGDLGWSLSASYTTLERIDLIADNEASWQDSGVLGNPGVFEYGSTGDHIVINEFLYDTPGTDSLEEWIELYNPTASAIDLSTYTIADNVAVFSLSGSIPANGYFVVATDATGFNALYGFNPDLDGMNLALANTGDQITLSDGSGEVDFVAYENYVAGWDLTASTGDVIERISYDNDVVSDFQVTSTATPGTANDGSGGGGDPTPDTESPVISINNPIDGSVGLGANVLISTLSSDNVGVTSVEIYIDNTLVSTGSSYLWDTTTYTDGTHTIDATAYDAAGNTGNAATITVSVDNANYEPPAIGEVKIMSYNIEASGANADYKQVLKEENADIAILIETGLLDDNNNAGLNALCTELNTYFAGLGEDPYTCVGTEGVTYSTSGEAVLTRFPVINTVQIPIVTLDDNTQYDVSHDFFDVTLDIAGTSTHIVASHLKCCGSDPLNYEKRQKQQEGIINYMDNLGNVPIIYAGDLNSFSPEDGTNNQGDLEYHPMSMMLRDTTFHDMSAYYSTVHTWDDPLTTLYPGQFFPTYGHQNPIYTSRIDFIVMNQFFDAVNYMSATVGDTPTANTGSDHYSTDVIYNFGNGGDPGDTTAPSQVTGLVAAVNGENQIDLSWNAASDDTGVDHYNIYRDSSFLTSVTGLSYNDAGLTADTTYTYTVSAVDAAGNEGTQSSSVSETTDAPAVLDEIHVAIIDVYASLRKGAVKYLFIDILIVDQNGLPVVGAEVTINIAWPDGTNEVLTAVTGSDGFAYFTLRPSRTNQYGTYSVTVTDITSTSYIYNPLANIETTDSYTN
ncbi:MAG: lamin tail domain-containing protein [Candidatus Heimdallarchaeota archaeon]|nr:lamin tail domain-containing protein [Candidatus Heimdallarchaeota archaeon]